MIYTGYFAKLKEYQKAGLTPVSIAGRTPIEGLIEWKFFAPTWSIFKPWKDKIIDNSEYTMRFTSEILGKVDKEEVRNILLSVDNPILLCYEKPCDFCHRHIVADWSKNNLQLNVEEYKLMED